MYINFMNEENKNIYVCWWLLLITLLVGLMIVVGGLTRLTDSGLSITKWNLFTGIFPPITLDKWNYTFDLYKQIPEFKLLNSDMTLNEFKVIYMWEYVHRLLGRIIGLCYIIPLLYFTFNKFLKKKDIFSFYLIFLLICFQGFIGWYMVKSGLSERTDVSHYRLSLHLTIAFIILIFLIWNFLSFKHSDCKKNKFRLPINLPLIFIFLVILQISFGAFVSGLDAGKIYQTWPMMNYSYYPDDASFKDLFSINSLEMPSMVQFIHRNLAYFIFLVFLLIFFIVFKNSEYSQLRKTILVIFFTLLLQIFLGILTILSGAQIYLASMHQIGSIFLILSSVVFVFKNYRLTNSF